MATTRAVMTDGPRKPFWKRKRWIAATVLWLVIAYVTSMGPACYAVRRGWLPLGPAATFYEPLSLAMRPFPAVQSMMNSYSVWWSRLANPEDPFLGR